MKALLLNMPVRLHAVCNNVPLGLYHVGRALQDEGMEVEYLDLNLTRKPPAGLPKADVYMMSGLITTFLWQRAVALEIRREYPKVPIISGGGLATNIGMQLKNWMPIDVVCFGEGEPYASILTDDLQPEYKLLGGYTVPGPESLDDVPDPIWDDVQGLETYIRNPIWGCGAQNSSYAPFTMDRSMNLVVSRGCPYSCKFCSKDALGGQNYRIMSPERIMDMVSRLVQKYNLDFIGFTDDNLLVKRAHAEKLCELFIETGLPVKWGCHARFDECADPEFLELLSSAGCVYLGFGGESANRDILASMGKGNDPILMRYVLRRVREAGIHPNVTWMMGWPGETRAQVRETAQFILKYAPENRSMFCATAYPGTELWKMVTKRILMQFTLRAYVEKLDDATEPIVNLSAMSDEDFHEVRDLIDRGELEGV